MNVLFSQIFIAKQKLSILLSTIIVLGSIFICHKIDEINSPTKDVMAYNLLYQICDSCMSDDVTCKENIDMLEFNSYNIVENKYNLCIYEVVHSRCIRGLPAVCYEVFTK